MSCRGKEGGITHCREPVLSLDSTDADLEVGFIVQGNDFSSSALGDKRLERRGPLF